MSEISIDLSGVHNHLSEIESHIAVVNRNLSLVGGKVEHVAAEQEAARGLLERLSREFDDFRAADSKEKEWQRAKTELGTITQEIEKNFSHYAAPRRVTSGILQATSLEIVRKDTIGWMSESIMIATPRYWLPAALVALSAWINDDRDVAERAMKEALKRDDSKTSLFFALVCRRARRMEATTKWLARYFQNQNPLSMDREVVVMLNGLANGIFGGGALQTCSGIIEKWLEELEAEAGFLDEQRKRWADKLDVMAPRPSETDYPNLRQTPLAGTLLSALSAARRNQAVLDFFTGLFSGEVIVPPSLEVAIDELLESSDSGGNPKGLVWNPEDDELPLLRKLRLMQLINDEKGDRAVAERRLEAEGGVLEEKTSFAALLTNAAMNPEQMDASLATQRYAVSRCRQWILTAHSDLVARDRANMPRQVDLEIGSWKGQSVDGSNEKALLDDLGRNYSQRIVSAVAAVKLSAGVWMAVIAGSLFGMAIMAGRGAAIFAGLVVVGLAVAFAVWKYQGLDAIRASVRQALEKEHEQARRVLKACLAELADYRAEVALEDAKSKKVAEFLESLSAPQFSLQRPDQRVAIA